MIKGNSLLFVVLILANTVHAQQAIIQKADLKEVTVYTNTAEMMHTATINLPLGSNEIVLTHIANQVDANSIQIGAGTDVTILSVRHAVDYIETDVRTDTYRIKENAYKEALNILKGLQNEKATAESVLKLLEQNQKIAGEHSNTTVAELAKMVEFYKTQYLDIKNTISALEEKITAQQEVVNKAKIQFDEVKGQTSGSGGQLIAQVVSNRAGNHPFSISYLARNASWSASYDLRAENIHSPLQIIYKANVIQQTGVDWKQVKLQLSSSNPSQSGAAPTLRPWHLYFDTRNALNANQPVMIRGVAAEARVESSFQKTASDQIEVVENQLNATFDIHIPYSIASNGRPHSVNLQEYSHPADYQYYAAPRVSRDVFLMAGLTDYGRLNLLPGTANVIFENMLAGKTVINPYATDDTLKLSLGRDRMISVNRQTVSDHSSTRIIGNNRTQSLLYEITVKNNKNVPIDLVLQDQYPLSTDRQIEISVDEASNADIDRETGIVTWRLTIPAGGSHRQRFGYSVRYPKDREIRL